MCTSANDAAIGHPLYLCMGQALRRIEIRVGGSKRTSRGCFVLTPIVCTPGLIIKNTVHYSAFRDDESPDCSLFIYKSARLQCRSHKTTSRSILVSDPNPRSTGNLAYAGDHAKTPNRDPTAPPSVSQQTTFLVFGIPTAEANNFY